MNEKHEIYHFASQAICDRFFIDFFYKLSKTNQYYQNIFVPYDKKSFSPPNIEQTDVNYYFLPIKNKTDRFFYFKKVRKYKKQFLNTFSNREIHNEKTIFHAHSLFTDGSVSYELSKLLGIPLVISIRTTDTQFYLRYFRYLKKYVIRILNEASHIIFISSNIKNELYSHINDDLKHIIDSKSSIIGNGVNDYWIQNIYNNSSRDLSTIRLIQISRLTKIKNAEFSLLLLRKLLLSGYDAKLKIIGNGKEMKSLKKISIKYKLIDCVQFFGHVTDKNLIRDELRKSNVFILPSKSETFGIVFLEAMSQGLPLIYTFGQGIYGIFPEGYIGFGIMQDNIEDAVNAIKKIMASYKHLSLNALMSVKQFSWEENVNKHIRIYNSFV